MQRTLGEHAHRGGLRRGHLLSLALLALALAIGTVVRVDLASTAPPFLVANDSADYFSAGFHLLTSGDLQLSLKRTPLYAVFLAGLIDGVGPSLDRIVAAQHVLGLLTIVLTYLLGCLAYGRLTGSIAALGVAINGSLLTMEHLLISESLFTPLLLASLAALLLAHRSGRSGLWLLAGLLCGLDALCRPLGIGVLGVGVVMLPFVGLPRRARLQAAGLLLVGTLVCLTPWIVRQQLAHEQAVVNGGLGDALFSRVHRYDPTFTLQADGWPWASSDPAVRARIVELARRYDYPREVRADLRAELGIGDRDADRALRDVALATIVHDPGRYLLGTLSMTGSLAHGAAPSVTDFWLSVQRDRVVQGWPADLQWALTTSRPLDDTAAFDWVASLLALYRDDLPGSLVPLALAPLGAAWLLLAHRQRGTGLIPLVILSQLLLYVALDGPLYRYRFPLQPEITLLGAVGLALVAEQIATAWRATGPSVASPASIGAPMASVGVPISAPKASPLPSE